MTSSRRIALSLCLVAASGGALLFTLSSATGQPSSPSSGAAMPPSSPMSPSSGAAMPPSSSMSPGPSSSMPGPSSSMPGPSSSMPGSSMPGSSMPGSSGDPNLAGAAPSMGGAVTTTTPSPTLKQTIGISPVQLSKQNFIVFGGTGNESYDLQNENVYSLLRQSGVPIPNVLHPNSTAKPSFIVERLIVLFLTGGSGSSNASGGTSQAAEPRGGLGLGSSAAPGASGAATAPQGPSDAEKTISQVRAVVDAEISRGSGRLGGAHRRKLQLLRNAIASIEQANSVSSVVTQAVGAGQGRDAGSSGGGGTTSKTDPRELSFGQARVTSRAADRYAPTGI